MVAGFTVTVNMAVAPAAARAVPVHIATLRQAQVEIYNRARANLVTELVKLPVVDPSTELEASSAALAVVVLYHEFCTGRCTRTIWGTGRGAEGKKTDIGENFTDDDFARIMADLHSKNQGMDPQDVPNFLEPRHIYAAKVQNKFMFNSAAQ